MKGFKPLSSKKIREVLTFPGDFQGNEEAACRQLVEELSKDEREYFARRSYTYWYAVMTDGPLPEKTIIRVARREALPIYRGKKHDYAKALASMKAIISFRKVRTVKTAPRKGSFQQISHLFIHYRNTSLI